jgi:hypothetical protein
MWPNEYGGVVTGAGRAGYMGGDVCLGWNAYQPAVDAAEECQRCETAHDFCENLVNENRVRFRAAVMEVVGRNVCRCCKGCINTVLMQGTCIINTVLMQGTCILAD